MNDLQDLFSALGPFMMYAEIHRGIVPIPNLLNNRFPEIVADAPSRIEKNAKLPLLLLVKDAHLYPIDLVSASVEITQAGKTILRKELLSESVRLTQRLWHRLVEIEPEAEGQVEIDVLFAVRRYGKIFKFRNHSYRIRSRKKLRTFLSSEELPDSRRIIYGDVHYHSSYTEDFVEFGAPLEATARMAKAMGLAFFAVTDHSFDLDNDPADPSKSDPDLRKWRLFLEDCAAVDGRDAAVLPGIEVSAGSAKGRNAHLLILNPARFHPGGGDSDEAWFKNRPDVAISEILGRLDPGELAVAAHPFNKVPLAQQILLKRGRWGAEDIRPAGLAGLQIFNGAMGGDLKRSVKKWIGLLLRGEKKFICAGNDAHGDFNRRIWVKIPFFRLKEDSFQIFGFMKTGIPSALPLGRDALVSHLRRGRCFVTTGPSILFHLHDGDTIHGPGDEAAGGNPGLSLEIKSIREFGSIASVSIIQGDLNAGTENTHVIGVRDLEFHYRGPLPFAARPERGYIRIACESERGMALSNPVWFTK